MLKCRLQLPRSTWQCARSNFPDNFHIQISRRIVQRRRCLALDLMPKSMLKELCFQGAAFSGTPNSINSSLVAGRCGTFRSFIAVLWKYRAFPHPRPPPLMSRRLERNVLGTCSCSSEIVLHISHSFAFTWCLVSFRCHKGLLPNFKLNKGCNLFETLWEAIKAFLRSTISLASKYNSKWKNVFPLRNLQQKLAFW